MIAKPSLNSLASSPVGDCAFVTHTSEARMAADGHEATSIPVSDNDRLIAVLQLCFSELITSRRNMQRVEALKPPAPAADKKSEFWNAYMKLADEDDKEFQKKYSSDLDTTLILCVAGLFSAVSSAFIIQLVYHALAALFAVLGKQWIMYYQTAGSRGTIEERGLERQRKLDGLRRWKFDLILQMFPLLLQLALLVFSSALSVYLWNIHRSVAIIVLALTLFGVASYICFLVTAIISPDCPFQTPLAPVLVRALSPIWHILKSIIITLGDHAGVADPYYDNYYLSPPSVEVSAVLWVLETSSDPAMITASATMAADLQWPLTLDLIPSMTRFYDTFSSCFDIVPQGPQLLRKVRVVRHQEYPIPWALLEPIKGAHDDHPQWAKMLELFRIIDMQPVLMNDSTVIKWVLHVIPSSSQNKPPGLDHSGFANYLCCLNSCFGPMSPRIIAQIDKRRLQPVLMAQLLKSLRIGTIAATLARVDDMSIDLQDGPYLPQAKQQEVEWLYIALEHLQRLWEQNRTDCQDPKWDRNCNGALPRLIFFSLSSPHTFLIRLIHTLLIPICSP
ncbi:hypothetical protein B0H13DRAFT_2677296 [Mycena leptocephala]|nr:hypothetical protein B0H13DRAFT_2677296 [Mycena leptocephala]